MGFFSFLATDTRQSVYIYQPKNANTHVRWTLLDNQGNAWTEDKYEGYGVFGGKDIYELIATMNGKTGWSELDYDLDDDTVVVPDGPSLRTQGIDLHFADETSRDGELIYPNLVCDDRRAEPWTWRNAPLQSCPTQGWGAPPTETKLASKPAKAARKPAKAAREATATPAQPARTLMQKLEQDTLDFLKAHTHKLITVVYPPATEAPTTTHNAASFADVMDTMRNYALSTGLAAERATN